MYITFVLVLVSNYLHPYLLGSASTVWGVVFCRRSFSVRYTLYFLGKAGYQSVRYSSTL